MINASSSPIMSNDHIRKLDMGRDLDQVADLIEGCFPIHLDYDGQTYIKEMRKTAQDMRFIKSFSGVSGLSNSKAPGYIWEEDDRIVGNLSMIPFKDRGRDICLIANVVVAPGYRQRGIARALTNRALAFLRGRGVSQVWLQVRDDNLPARQLYQSTGFVDQFVRTTWRLIPNQLSLLSFHHEKLLGIRKRNRHDPWKKQIRWLSENYPETIRWNLSVNFSLFEPGILQMITNILNGVILKHWTIIYQDDCCGFISWQKTTSYANNLWLAIPEDKETIILPIALTRVMKSLSGKHPISVDYPQGRFTEGFKSLGFECFRSLVWMKQDLN